MRRLAALAIAALLLAALAAAILPRLRAPAATPEGRLPAAESAAPSMGAAPLAAPTRASPAGPAAEARTRTASLRATFRASVPGDRVRALALALEKAAAEGSAGRPEDRLAAARALRDSADLADAREGLLERVERESDIDTAATAAIGVGAWAASVPPGSEERARALERLLDALPRADEGVHAALAPSLGEARLSEAEAQRLLEMTRAGDARLRRFAVETLMGQLERERARPGDPRVEALGGALGGDGDPEVRRAAAFSLERAVPDPAAVAALVASLRRDPDADERAAAARSLVRAAHRSEPALEALRGAARGDPDEHVRDAARESLPVGR